MTQPVSTITGKDIKVKVYDPPGQKRYFNDFVKQYLRVDGVILVYDVTNNDSFSEIKELHTQVVSTVVKENQVQEFANDIDCDYYETTATNPSTIDIAFCN
ncbi:hypothetical protein ACTFIT_003749 [Dictyostelium discoideum]